MAVDPEREVLVTNGATGAFQAAVMALLNPGDEVLLFEPFYGYHASTLRSIRAVAVPVALRAPDWGLDLEAVRAAITPKTRGMVINTPSNPGGKGFYARGAGGVWRRLRRSSICLCLRMRSMSTLFMAGRSM